MLGSYKIIICYNFDMQLYPRAYPTVLCNMYNARINLLSKNLIWSYTTNNLYGIRHKVAECMWMIRLDLEYAKLVW